MIQKEKEKEEELRKKRKDRSEIRSLGSNTGRCDLWGPFSPFASVVRMLGTYQSPKI